MSDKQLLNHRYIILILKYFFINLIDPFQKFLEDHEQEKIKLNKLIRVKLMVFLVKTKVMIKFIDNCCQVKNDDILRYSTTTKERSTLELNITYVCLDNKDKCKEDYEKIGKNMQRFLFSLLKSNNITINYRDSMKLINNPDYYDMALDPSKLNSIEKKLKNSKIKDILTPMAIFNYIGTTFNSTVPDYTELHLCFPDPEFLYMYYRLIDSKWSNMGMSILSSNVKSYKKFYIPLDIFEGEFTENRLYPQTKVRILKNLDFLETISPDFLIQKEFINKRSMRKAFQPEFVDYFKDSVADYRVFNRHMIKGIDLTIRGIKKAKSGKVQKWI